MCFVLSLTKVQRLLMGLSNQRVKRCFFVGVLYHVTECMDVYHALVCECLLCQFFGLAMLLFS